MFWAAPITIAGSFAFAFYTIHKQIIMHIDPNYIYLGCIFISFGLLTIWAVINLYLTRYLPLSADDDSISTYFRGHKFKSIQWKDVSRIERKYFSDAICGDLNLYGIYGPTGVIWFSEQLKNVRPLLDQINIQIRRYGIEVISIDSTKNTIVPAMKNLSSRSERFKIMKEGVRTKIQQL